MAKRLIATNKTGVDGNTRAVYTGRGAGKIQVLAEYTTRSGVIQSKTYEVVDALFYDTGVTGTKNNNWQSLRLTSLTDDEGTSLTATCDYAHYLVKSSSARFSVNFSIEFQTLTCNQSALNFVDSSTNVDRKEYLKPDTHYKFRITSTGYEVYENGTYTKKVDLTFASVRVSFYLPNASSSVLKYNSFVLYAYDPADYIILSLTGDKSIIQTGEEVTFTAEVINGLGEPVSSLNVDFVDDVSQSVILTGVTDSDGVVNGVYTGVGAGEVEFVAYNKERTLSSETYATWDTIWYDKDSATWNVSNGSTSYSDNTRSITLNSNSGLANPSIDGSSFFIPCTDDFIVEFDYGGGNMSLYFAINGMAYNMGISLNFAKYNNKTLKLLVKPSEDKTDVYIDGVYDNTVTNTRSFATSETCALHIRTNWSSGANATFSNLKIYRA